MEGLIQRCTWQASLYARWRTSAEALWGSKVSPATISEELNKSLRSHRGLAQPSLAGRARYPYVCVDGIYLRRNWGGGCENVAILVAIAVNETVS